VTAEPGLTGHVDTARGTAGYSGRSVVEIHTVTVDSYRRVSGRRSPSRPTDEHWAPPGRTRRLG